MRIRHEVKGEQSLTRFSVPLFSKTQGVAAVYASDGRGLDRPRVDAARSADVSGATVAATSCRVKSGWGDNREARQVRCACDRSPGWQEAPKNRMRGLMPG